MAALPSHFPQVPAYDSDVWKISPMSIREINDSLCEEDAYLVRQIRRWRAAWMISKTDTVTVCASTGLTRDMGWTESDVLNKSIYEKLCKPQMDVRKARILKRKVRSHSDHHCIISSKHANGETISCSTCYIALRNKEGNVKFHMLVIKRIALDKPPSMSERSQARKKFLNLLAQAERANAIRDLRICYGQT